MPHRTPHSLRQVTAWLALALLLGACASREPTTPPVVQLPAQYRQADAAVQAGVWQTAQTGAPVPAQWWTLYGDPVLDTLMQQALEGNQNLAQSMARVRAAQAAVEGSSANLWPTLGVTASTSRARSNSTASDGTSASRISSSHALGLNASWELDLWGRVAAGVDAARANAQASASDLAAARLSLQAAVAQAYFSLRAAEAQSQLLQDTLQAYARSWELTRHRQRAGVATLADVAQAEVQYKNAQSQTLEVRTTRQQLEHALAALLGQVPATFSLQATAVLPQPPAVPGELPAVWLQRRPDITAAERRVAAANAQLGVAQAAYFPAITLSASAGFRGSAWSQLLSAPHAVWSLGPALAASLFDGGARRAAQATALAAQDQAAAAYRQTVLTALQEVEDNLVAATSLVQQQQLQTEAVQAGQRALEVVQAQYQAGTVGFLNVLAVQTSVLSAQRNLIDVRLRRLSAVNTLLKNVAGGWKDAPAS